MDAPFAELLRYNGWANATLIEACRGLDESLLWARPAGLSGSIGELWTHLAGGQQTFVLRLKGRQNEGELTRASAWPGMAAIEAILRETSDALVAAADALAPGATAILPPYFGKQYRFPQAFFLLHAVTHGIEHRTELKCGLAALGISTPDLDAWSYAAAAGIGEEVA